MVTVYGLPYCRIVFLYPSLCGAPIDLRRHLKLLVHQFRALAVQNLSVSFHPGYGLLLKFYPFRLLIGYLLGLVTTTLRCLLGREGTPTTNAGLVWYVASQ